MGIVLFFVNRYRERVESEPILFFGYRYRYEIL